MRMRLGVFLTTLATVAALAAGGLALKRYVELADTQAKEQAEDNVFASFQSPITRLEELGQELADGYGEITRAPATATGPFRGEGKAWLQIDAVLRALDRDLGTRLAVYEEPADADAADFTLLGHADGGGVVRDVDADWPGRIPEAVRRVILQKLDVGDDVAPYCWFSQEVGGPVRLNLVLPSLDDYDAPEDADEEHEGLTVTRLFHMSAWWRPAAAQVVTVRVDVIDGEVMPDLPTVELRGERASARVSIKGTAVDPDVWVMSWPVRSNLPRIMYAEQGPTLSLLYPILGSLALLLSGIGAVLAVWGSRREEVGVPPDVTAEAAHEMRTPLTAMRGEIEVTLRRERSAEEYRASLESTLDEVKGLQGILNNVLLLTRGAFTAPAKEPVDLAAVLGAEIERVGATNEERRVTLDAPADAVMVTGDPSLLARAVGNLLDNAALHSTAGGPIHAALTVERGTAVLTITDDGPGIPRSRHEKIFQRFYRGPEVGQRAIPGSGLGLPISRWIAELHGGTLGIDPSLIASTRFELRLPTS